MASNQSNNNEENNLSDELVENVANGFYEGYRSVPTFPGFEGVPDFGTVGALIAGSVNAVKKANSFWDREDERRKNTLDLLATPTPTTIDALMEMAKGLGTRLDQINTMHQSYIGDAEVKRQRNLAKRTEVVGKQNEVNNALYDKLSSIVDPWMERDRMAGLLSGKRTTKNSFTGQVPNPDEELTSKPSYKNSFTGPVPKPGGITAQISKSSGNSLTDDEIKELEKVTDRWMDRKTIAEALYSGDSDREVDEFDAHEANQKGEGGWGHTRGWQGGGYGF